MAFGKHILVISKQGLIYLAKRPVGMPTTDLHDGVTELPITLRFASKIVWTPGERELATMLQHFHSSEIYNREGAGVHTDLCTES